MSYGEKIAALRRRKGMTQAELGAELNVTYQAVSKWERDESDPDFATMSKIAKLFEVPLSFFEDNEDNEENAENAETTTDGTETAAVAEVQPTQSEQNIPMMLGVCTVCGRTVYEGNVGEESPALVCKSCKGRQTTEKDRAARERIKRAAEAKTYEQSRQISRRNRGLIASAIITAAALIASIISFATTGTEAGIAIGSIFGIIIFFYPFVAQLFWDGFIVEVVLAGVKVVGTPGIIFTFDLDGIIFLIIMKILFAILKIIVFFLIFLFMMVVAMILSPFAIVPQAISLSRGNIL